MKLTTLKPTIATQAFRLPTLQGRPDATPRLRGRAAVDRRARWLKLHPMCVDCSAMKPARCTVAMEVDHEVPLWKGGADIEANFASRCVPHHAAKTAREAKERGNAQPRGAW